FALAATVMVGLKEPAEPDRERRSIWRESYEGLRYVVAHPTLRGLAVSISLSNIGAGGTLVIAVPVLLLNRLHSGTATIGWVFGVFGVASLVSALVFGRMNTEGRERSMLAWSMIAVAIALLALAAAGALWVVFAAAIFAGLVIGASDVGLFSIRQRRTDPAWFGRAFAVSMSLNYMAAPQAVLLLLAALAPLAQARPVAANPGDVTAFAGGGLGAGPALKVGQQPVGVTASATRIYVSDTYANVVRMVDTSTGTETVVAGTGTPGSFGDEGPATSAMLDDPRGLSLDAAGDLFIADRVNNRIRKVTPDGKIHTVAGNGIAGYSGNGGAATSASLSFPQAVFSDPASGNLYVADTENDVVRVVKTDGTISTAAGTIPVGWPCQA